MEPASVFPAGCCPVLFPNAKRSHFPRFLRVQTGIYPQRLKTGLNSSSAEDIPALYIADEVARRSFPTGYGKASTRPTFECSLTAWPSSSKPFTTRGRSAGAGSPGPRTRQLIRRWTKPRWTAALGQETTRVLRSDHDAAGDMKARAEEGAHAG